MPAPRNSAPHPLTLTAPSSLFPRTSSSGRQPDDILILLKPINHQDVLSGYLAPSGRKATFLAEMSCLQSNLTSLI
eukprot:768072-Hanusia_phi.AAC.2